ncbi:hypothetical protein BGZ68_005592 [Mortierella alpina]|nr:hypothetical protein BGZ68_005592 [Mortierella alpina]
MGQLFSYSDSSQTSVFTVNRFQLELRAEFQQELDNMLKAVNALRSEVEAALSSQKATLVERGNAIQRQAKGLQHEAALLYTKGKSELNPEDKALA